MNITKNVIIGIINILCNIHIDTLNQLLGYSNKSSLLALFNQGTLTETPRHQYTFTICASSRVGCRVPLGSCANKGWRRFCSDKNCFLSCFVFCHTGTFTIEEERWNHRGLSSLQGQPQGERHCVSTGWVCAHHNVVNIRLTIETLNVSTVRVRIHWILKEKDGTHGIGAHLCHQLGVFAKRTQFAHGSTKLVHVFYCTQHFSLLAVAFLFLYQSALAV